VNQKLLETEHFFNLQIFIKMKKFFLQLNHHIG